MKKKVVVIEDNSDNTEVIRIALESKDIKVFSAVDGASGMELIQKQMPDGVVLDIMVPKMNGYEVCTAMQKDDKLQKIPIMVLTGLTEGNDSTEDADWCRRLEVAAFMSKPFDTNELAERVRAMVGA